MASVLLCSTLTDVVAHASLAFLLVVFALAVSLIVASRVS